MIDTVLQVGGWMLVGIASVLLVEEDTAEQRARYSPRVRSGFRIVCLLIVIAGVRSR